MQIARITKTLGTLSLLNFARKHVEKLIHHERDAVKAEAPRVQLAIEDLENAYAARRPLLALWSAATAAKDAADDALDQAISSLSYDLLSPSLLNKDRSGTAYRVLFPNGTIDFIHGPDRAQLAHVNGMVEYLSSHPDHPMAGRAADLAGKVETVATTLAEATAREARYRDAQKVEADSRKELARALRKSVWMLRDAFDGDESQVDRLFPTVAEATVPEEPEPPTPA